MKNLYYKTKRTYDAKVGKQSFTLPSETIPDETFTIPELLIRHSQGMQIQRHAITYFDEEDLQKINQFYSPNVDLTDLEKLNENIQSLQTAVQRAQNRKQQELDDKDNAPRPGTPEPSQGAETDPETDKE